MTNQNSTFRKGSAAADRGINWPWLGILLGGFVAQSVTISRWVTSEPYHALFIPYDWVLLVLISVIACVITGAWAARKCSQTFLQSAVVALLAAAISYVWVMTVLPGSGYLFMRLTVIAVCSAVLTLCLFAWQAAHGRYRGPGIEYFGIYLSGMLVLALCGYLVWKPLVCLYPLALVSSFMAGIPVLSTNGYRRGFLALAIAALVTVVCFISVHPRSGQLVDTTSHVAARTGQSVILVVLDTLRKDHMSLYGYPRNTTPNIDAWSKNALVFENSTAVSSWTLPTHASMFTGLYPRTHGAHGFRSTEGQDATVYPLPDTATTLAELVAAADIETAAIVANFAFLTPKYGLDQGFQTYWVRRPVARSSVFPLADMLASHVTPWRYLDTQWRYYRDNHMTDNAIRWLDANRKQPFFLFLNYMDAHDPNAREASDVVPLEEELPASAQLLDLSSVWEYKPLDEITRRTLVNNYDREISHLDGELERLFEYLDSSGLSNNTTVILTSDHGEYLGEHSLTTHSKDLHEEVISVPLIIRGPAVTPGHSIAQVQSPDIFPTVLDLLGLHPAAGIQGHSVLDLHETRPAIAEWYKATNPGLLKPRYHERFDRDLRTITLNHYKLFADDRGRLQLYNLQDDPHELTDLAATDSTMKELLLDRLEKWLQEYPAAEIQDELPGMSPENLEQLRSLGYID